MNASSSPKDDVVSASDDAARDQRPGGRGDDGPAAGWVEAVATVILALTAVATARSGHQASHWHGEQTIAFSRANAGRLDGTAGVDPSLGPGRHSERDRRGHLQPVGRRLRPPRDPAGRLLPQTIPSRIPAGRGRLDGHPPARERQRAPDTVRHANYRLAAAAEAERLQAAAEASRDIQHANDYVLAVVLFSTALFFGGISTRMQGPRPRAVLLGVGCAVLVGALAWVATFPISIST